MAEIVDTYATAFRSVYAEILITARDRTWLDHGLRPLFMEAERTLGPLGTEVPAGQPQ